MGALLATSAWLIGLPLLWAKPERGELRLEGGLVAFTLEESGLVFRVPVEEVRASFPKMYLGVGAKLAVRGKTYRLWFVPLVSISDPHGAHTSMAWQYFAPVRARVRQWRAALEPPTNGDH
jgi:hypothetical protein